MDKFEHNPLGHSWTESGQWWREPQDIALAHTPAFAQRFFSLVFNEFPVLINSVVFWRWSVQPEHLYAIFNLSGGEFGVQIDPNLEYIMVWGEDENAEYGNWGCDPVIIAVEHVRTLVWWFENLSNTVK
jgi:hypothetical protein